MDVWMVEHTAIPFGYGGGTAEPRSLLQRLQLVAMAFKLCEIRASNAIFGDPCEGTFKYLEVRYSCEMGNFWITYCIYLRMMGLLLRILKKTWKVLFEKKKIN